MPNPFIDASRIKHSPGPYHYDESRMNICTSKKCDWVDDDDEDPAYETVIHTQSAMGGSDTKADIRLLMASPCMFDLLNRIAGGEKGKPIILEAQKLVEKVAG